MKLKDIMTREVVEIAGQATITTAAERMKSGKVSALPVIEHGRVAGILTDHDVVVRVLAMHLDPQQERVRDHMGQGPMHCYEDQDVKEAIQVMGQHHFRRLPILARDGNLVGIVTLSDLLRASKAEH